jgi:hypothetical protein
MTKISIYENIIIKKTIYLVKDVPRSASMDDDDGDDGDGDDDDDYGLWCLFRR